MSEIVLTVRVTPRGSKNEVLGFRGDVLHVKTTAPPVDGAANDAVVRIVAELLGVRPSKIEITSGEKSRTKTLRLLDLGPDALERLRSVKVQP